MAAGALKYVIEVDDKGQAKIKKFDDTAGKSLDKTKKRSEGLGKSFLKVTKLAAGVATAIGAIGAITLGGSLKAAIDFESAWIGVTKTVDASDEVLANLRADIKQMATEIPASTKEIAGVAEAAGQLGIKAENIAGFTRTMIDLGEATNLSSDEAATALARLANITQMPQTEFDRLGSTIVALGNNLATTEADIVSMASRLAGAGSQIGLSEDQIVSFAGALSSVGIEAEAGGTAFSRVMLQMNTAVANGGAELEKWARIAGESGSDFAETFRTKPQVALTQFIEGLAEMKAAGQNVSAGLEEIGLQGVRVQDALLRASGAGSLFADALELGAEAWDKNNALQKEAENRYASTASQLQILKNQIGGVFTSIGEGILPAFKGWITALQDTIRTAQEAGVIDEIVAQVALSVDAASEAFGRLRDWADDLLTAIQGMANDPSITWADVMRGAVIALGETFRFLLIEGEKAILGLRIVFAALGKAASEVWDYLKAAGQQTWLLLQAAAFAFLGAVVDQVFTPLKQNIDSLLDHLANIAFVIPGMEDTAEDLLQMRQELAGFGESMEGATEKSKELAAAAKQVGDDWLESRTMGDEYGQTIVGLSDRINELNRKQKELSDADFSGEIEKNAEAMKRLQERAEKQVEVNEKLAEAQRNFAEAQKQGGEFAIGAAQGLLKYAEAAEKGGFKTDAFKGAIDGARAYLDKLKESSINARKEAGGLSKEATKLAEKFGLMRADDAAKSMGDLASVIAQVKARGIESGPVFDKLVKAAFDLADDVEAAGLKLSDPFKKALEGIAGPGGKAALAVNKLVEEADRSGPAYDAMRAELEEINRRLEDTANTGPQSAAAIQAMKDRAKELERELRPAGDAVGQLVDQMEGLKRVEVQKELDNTRAALARMKEEGGYTAEAIQQMEGRARELEATLDPTAARTRELVEEATKASPAFDAVRQELDATNGALAILEDELGTTHPEVQILRERARELEYQLDETKLAMDNLAYSFIDGILGAQSFGDVLGGLGNALAGVMQQGGSFGDFFGSIKDMFSTEGMSVGEKFGVGLQGALGAFQDDTLNMGGKLAKAAGAGIGGFFGGPLGAALGGKIGGFLGGLFGGKATWKKIQDDVEKEMGVALSEGTAKAIADIKKELGVSRDVAILLGLDQIVAEAELAGDGIERFGQQALDALSLVAQGGEVGEQALAAADETIGMLIADAEEFGKTGDAAFRQFIAAAQESGVEVEALAEFIEGRLMMAVQGVTTMFQNMGEVGQAEFNDLAIIGNATLQAMREEMGLMRSMEEMVPAIDAMVEKQKELGLELNEDAKALVRMRNLFTENKEVIASIDGVQMAMQGLAEAGHLNQRTFDAFQRQTIRNNEKLLEGGFNQIEALEAQAPVLQEIVNHHLATGDAIDAETMALIQQAEAAGLVEGAGTGIESTFLRVGQAIVDVMGQAFGVEVPQLLYGLEETAANTATTMSGHFDTVGASGEEAAQSTVDAWAAAHEEVTTDTLLMTEEVSAASQQMVDEITGATDEGTDRMVEKWATTADQVIAANQELRAGAEAELSALEDTAVLAATGTADATADLVGHIAQKTSGFVGEAARQTIGFLDGVDDRLGRIFSAREAARQAEREEGGGQQYHAGGFVTGETGTAHRGEFVIKKDSAQKMDPNVLEAINRTGSVPARAVSTTRFPAGGPQAQGEAAAPSRGERGPTQVNVSGRMVIVLEDGTELKGTIRRWTQDQADDGSLIIGPDNIRDRRR